MTTPIYIKRSLNTASPGSLANGELAYTANGDVLYIGSNDSLVAISGKRVPGVLTANQALVTNSTNMIDVLRVGNSTVNSVLNSANLVISNSTVSFTLPRPSTVEQGGNYYLKADGSWSTVTGATADPAGANTNIQYNDSGVMNGTDAFTFDEASNNVLIANSLFLGDGTTNAVVNTSLLRLANSTVTFDIIKPTTTEVSAANYYLASDSTWKQISVSSALDDLTDVTIVTAANNQLLVYDNDASQWENHDVGNGFVFSAQVMAVKANNGIIANTSGLFADAANGISVDAAGINVLANNGILANSSGVWAVGANGISITSAGINVLAGTDGGLISNATGTWVKAGTGVTVNSSGVNIGQAVGTSDNVTFANIVTTDITVSGNLDVTGTLTTVDTVNLVVNDSIISLARNNPADTLDIGFYGQYNDGTERFTGLIWDTTSDTWELFANTTAEPTTTVDTGGTGFVRSKLNSYLRTGWGTGLFEANSTGTTITANSTWAVALTANTLSLSSPLPGTSGGTGLGSFSDQDLLVANDSNGFTALAIGGTEGYVLQVNATAGIEWGAIDGGTF